MNQCCHEAFASALKEVLILIKSRNIDNIQILIETLELAIVKLDDSGKKNAKNNMQRMQ